MIQAAAAEEQAQVNPSPTTQESAVEAQRLLFAAPTLMLHTLSPNDEETKTPQRVIANRVALAEAGEWAHLRAEYVNTQTAVEANDRKKALFRCESVAVRGDTERHLAALMAMRQSKGK